jgi:hypothetical protein
MSFAKSARIIDASKLQLRFHRTSPPIRYIAAIEERADITIYMTVHVDITIYMTVHAMDFFDKRQD